MAQRRGEHLLADVALDGPGAGRGRGSIETFQLAFKMASVLAWPEMRKLVVVKSTVQGVPSGHRPGFG